jgi:hypothetical protein
MDLLLVINSPFVGRLIPCSDARTKVDLCDLGDYIEVFPYSLGGTA